MTVHQGRLPWTVTIAIRENRSFGPHERAEGAVYSFSGEAVVPSGRRTPCGANFDCGLLRQNILQRRAELKQQEVAEHIAILREGKKLPPDESRRKRFEALTRRLERAEGLMELITEYQESAISDPGRIPRKTEPPGAERFTGLNLEPFIQWRVFE